MAQCPCPGRPGDAGLGDWQWRSREDPGLAGGKLDRLLCSWRFLGVLVPENADLTWSWERATIPLNPPAGIRIRTSYLLLLGATYCGKQRRGHSRFLLFFAQRHGSLRNGVLHIRIRELLVSGMWQAISVPRVLDRAAPFRLFAAVGIRWPVCWRAGVLPTRVACRWWFCVPQCTM